VVLNFYTFVYLNRLHNYYTDTCELLLKTHEVPVESLEKTNEVFAIGLLVEYIEPHGFKKMVPFVILYGEFFVESIGFPFESCGSPFAFVPDG
jgi:hypothetical protein